MTLPGFSALINAWWFLLLIPLVIFYFLKLRRPRVEIPSLALWRQVITDQRVNSPFQKFRRNLLLLLQILLLCALVIGAMQPYLYSNARHVQNLPVMIDTSASMAALDEPGGRSRLAEAKEKIGRLIDDLLPDQQICLISVNSTARRLTDFTNNKRLLRETLAGLQPTHVPSRLVDGFRLTQALSRGNSIETAILMSDGNVPQDIEFELPFKLNFQKLKPGGTNVGIVDFNARRSRNGWEVFARIEGAPGTKMQAEYELLQNGQKIKTELISIEGPRVVPEKAVEVDSEKKVDQPAGERLMFKISTDTAAMLELRLKPDGFDALDVDNYAYLSLPRPRQLEVYCPEEMKSFRNALAIVPGLNLYPGPDATPSAVDLKFAEGPVSTGPEARVNLNVGFVPDDLSALVELESGLAEIVDWQRTAPLLQHVQLLDVQIGDQPKLAAGISERDFEAAGYEILAESRTGPLILERPGDGRLDLCMLFHPDRSSLVFRVGFPILVQNVTQIALSRARLLDAKAIPTGEIPARKLEPEKEYQISGPSGYTETGTSDKNGYLMGMNAPYVGQYEINSPDTERIGASLVSTQETSLVSVDKLNFPENVSVSAGDAEVKGDQPLWGWFAAIGLGLLVVEWWFFQKKPAGVPG